MSVDLYVFDVSAGLCVCARGGDGCGCCSQLSVGRCLPLGVGRGWWALVTGLWERWWLCHCNVGAQCGSHSPWSSQVARCTSNAHPSTFPPLLCLTPYLTGLGDPETCCKERSRGGGWLGGGGLGRSGGIWRGLSSWKGVGVGDSERWGLGRQRALRM